MGSEQKVAIVTGASQGIGAAMVKAFRDRNFRVVATARSVEPSSDPDVISVSAQLEEGGASGQAEAAEMAIVRVTDHGPGIPDSDFAAIWEPFVRGRRGQGRSQGSGLGLAVVRLLAESVGWEVGVASVADNGTAGPGGATFFVRFPLAPLDAT